MGYRFTRGGIEVFGDSPEMFAGVVRARFGLSEQGQRIVGAVKSALGASVALHDSEKRKQYVVVREDRWLSVDGSATLEPARCYVRARISERWAICVFSASRLHPDAQTMAEWAAEKLLHHLPRSTADEPTSLPPGPGGGSSGSAELGIPVWWTRKARN
jgi:hypothetical protein